MRVEVVTPDGRVTPLWLDAGGRATLLETLQAGAHELRFHAGDYRRDGFYDVIAVRFLIDTPALPYHVPLILSAFGYSTYRGG
jgi:5-hydroxyisourate hydrolase